MKHEHILDEYNQEDTKTQKSKGIRLNEAETLTTWENIKVLGD